MKKLFVLLSVMFLAGSIAFAQSEKTVKQEKKEAKVESAEKQAKPAPSEKTMKANPQKPAEKKADTKATEKQVKPEKPAVKEADNKTEKKAQPEKPAVKTEKNAVKVEEKQVEKQAKPAEKPGVKTEKKAANTEKKTTDVSQDAENDGNGPEITFKETNHDFGTIPFKGNGTYEFVFVNTGNEPLILTQPKSSCGCTVPEWPKQPILPGESNVIRVTYKNTDRPGGFNKYVTVFSNALVNKEVKLHIKGTVEAEPTDAAPLMNSESPVKNN